MTVCTTYYEDFPSPGFFRVVPEKGCNAAAVHSLVDIVCRTITKPGPSLLFHGQLIAGHTPPGYNYMPDSRWHCDRIRSHRHLGNFFT